MSHRNHPEAALMADLLNDLETPLVKKILLDNQIIKHNYKKEWSKKEVCHLNGCSNTFEFFIIPNQLVYPKFCKKHRSKYQRDLLKDSK